jgi:hypothetical protein
VANRGTMEDQVKMDVKEEPMVEAVKEEVKAEDASAPEEAGPSVDNAIVMARLREILKTANLETTTGGLVQHAPWRASLRSPPVAPRVNVSLPHMHRVQKRCFARSWKKSSAQT